MIKPVQFFRMLKIFKVLMTHTFNRHVLGKHYEGLRWLSYFNPWSFNQQSKNRGESLRLALEELGPIFVKFGQVISMRSDLLPPDIISELEKLQDRVSPFNGSVAKGMIEKSLGKPVTELFKTFDETPIASASIAQVHAATMHDDKEVIVKVIRPNIRKTIGNDIALLYLVAKFTERFLPHGKRLRPVELVAEFETTIYNELDLVRESANASQLRRNFADSSIMYVPEVFWHYVTDHVMVQERIYGIPISHVKALKEANVDMQKLAENGVEIFFTQVFRDSFFHADMHPGNLFVDISDPQNPLYKGVDFGIMGSLTPEDQHYLAQNLMAFFNRDYREVAILHVESGWVPPDTRVDQLESAIRAVSEPIFEKPISEISFGQLLLRLFQTAKQFHMEVQPQLMLLQKTLLAIESLGRQLYPNLDLWTTAKPFMAKWIKQRRSIRRLSKHVLKNWPDIAEDMSKTPELAFNVLSHIHQRQQVEKRTLALDIAKLQQRKRGLLFGAGFALLVIGILNLITHSHMLPHLTWPWALNTIGVVFILFGWIIPK